MSVSGSCIPATHAGSNQEPSATRTGRVSELEGENLRQHCAYGLGGRHVSCPQILVGVAATAHPTGHVEQAGRRRTPTRSGLHRDPNRVELQPIGVKVAGQRLRDRRLTRAGRATDEDQAFPYGVIVSASGRGSEW
jgi:hypothetical protein